MRVISGKRDAVGAAVLVEWNATSERIVEAEPSARLVFKRDARGDVSIDICELNRFRREGRKSVVNLVEDMCQRRAQALVESGYYDLEAAFKRAIQRAEALAGEIAA